MSTRWLFALLLSLFLGGCSALRGVQFQIVGVANAPVPPGGTRTEINNAPFLMFGSPAIYVQCESPRNAASVLDFYRAALRQRGWTETPDSSAKGPPKPQEKGNNIYEIYSFQRQSKLGNWVYARERLDLTIQDYRLLKTDPLDLTHINIAFVGLYAWDAPGIWLAQTLEKPGGAWTWAMLTVTVWF